MIGRCSQLIAFISLLWAVSLPINVEAAEFLDRRGIINWLIAHDFDRLERNLAALQREFELTHDDQYLDHAFETFRRTDDVTAAAINEWVAARPNSAFALTARGVHNMRVGWHRRGAIRKLRKSDPELRKAFQEAIADFKSARDLMPRLPMAHGYLVSAYTATGEHNARGFAYRRAMHNVPDSQTVRWRYFFTLTPQWYGDRKDRDLIVKGEIIVANLLARFLGGDRAGAPAGFSPYIDGEIAAYNGKRGTALAHFVKTTNHPEVRWWAWRRMSNVLDAVDRDEEALEALNHAFSLSPDAIDLLEDRADLLREASQYDEAITTLESALFFDPAHPVLLTDLSRAIIGKAKKLKISHPDEARTLYKVALVEINKAMKFGGNHERVRKTRANLLLYNLDRHKDAEADFFFLTEHKSSKPAYHYGYAKSLALSWDCQSIDVYTRFLRMCEKKKCLSGQITRAKHALQSIADQGYCQVNIEGS